MDASISFDSNALEMSGLEAKGSYADLNVNYGKLHDYDTSSTLASGIKLDPSKIKTASLVDVRQVGLMYPTQKNIPQLDDGSRDQTCRCNNVCRMLYSIVSHICVIVCFSVAIWKGVVRADALTKDEEQANTAIAIALIFGLLFYAQVIVEARCSDTNKYLKNLMDSEEAFEHVLRTRMQWPTISWIVRCYHHHASETGVVSEITSFHTQNTFPLKRCEDASGDLDMVALRSNTFTRVEFQKAFSFMDEKTRNLYEQSKSAFLEEHREIDTFISLSEEIDIAGYRKRIVFCGSQSRAGCFKTRVAFWIATCFLLTWPYRMWFSRITEQKKFTYIKRVQTETT